MRDPEARYFLHLPPSWMPRDAALLWLELRDMPDQTELGLPERRAAARRSRPLLPLATSAMLALATLAVLVWATRHGLPTPTPLAG